MSQTSVDPSALRGLAGEAQSLSGEVTALGGMTPEVGVEGAGAFVLAAAIARFNESWGARASEMAAELADAGEFLRTFADAAEALDEALAD